MLKRAVSDAGSFAHEAKSSIMHIYNSGAMFGKIKFSIFPK